ncbi:MAG: S8 family serine peptidase [Candidatus Sericytochromatia bacterium]
MRKTALIAGVILLSGIHAPSAVAAPLPSDAVSVTFKEPVGDRFVGMFHEIMGTETIAKASPTRYTFRISSRGNQNDYAVLFAHLPYVREVAPLPRLAESDKGMPEGVVAIGPQAVNRPPGYVPGQLLVRLKPNVRPEAISELNSRLGTQLKERIAGIDVFLLTLPEGLSVEEAQRRFLDSGLVQYAEPNRTMTLPRQPDTNPVPADNGGPGIYLSPDRLLGHHLLVRYREGGPVPALINQIYGTKTLERTAADEVRLTLPPNVNPQLASRMFRLCPYVISAEPAYGR